ncbi:DsbA family protein [Xylanimonas allomyrinae]|uniref:DsbA family protein n=1 Tax=Xylanimonas allomyrinae TaxID=2509459 RepID=UPI001FE8E1ED|nr:DsbA family protein [Xylanimonas allomyrinae]
MRPTVKRLVALVGLTAVLALSACADAGDAAEGHAVTDPSVGIAFDGDGAAVVPSQDAQVVVEVFSDFLCPFCKQFEESNADALLELAGDDRFDVRWRPVAWLDRHSGAPSSRPGRPRCCCTSRRRARSTSGTSSRRSWPSRPTARA